MTMFAQAVFLGELRAGKTANCLATPLLSRCSFHAMGLESSEAAKRAKETQGKAEEALRSQIDLALRHKVPRYTDADDFKRWDPPRNGEKRLSGSLTFGTNDPLTVAWIAEVLDLKQVSAEAFRTARRVAARILRKPDAEGKLGRSAARGEAHALAIVRAVHIANRLELRSDLDPAFDWLNQRLHLQLSYAQLSNASFDAPELIFCLEGLLAITRDAEGLRELVMSVVDRVGEKQKTNPNLRPYRPILSNERGLALLPLTIEVFNSLLRILEMLAETKVFPDVPERVLPILDRYVDWLTTQVSVVTVKGGNQIVGWSSEHTQAKSRLHVWETSQVLVFLAHYTVWLEAQTQRDALHAANFVPQEVKTKECFWPANRRQCAKLEPNASAQVYRRLLDLLQPAANNPKGYSALLYGPPGTGKTKIAKWVAWSLKMPLLSLTPSDFILGGEHRVEERAKMIFQVLSTLSDHVIFFDEIDRLLLDRNAPEYGMQSDMFQFMTPSMLTKIHDLREAKKCVFLIGTNYEERIDAAIKRKGRIDERVLVLPPDRKARLRFFAKSPRREWLAERTALCVYPELEEIARAPDLDSVTEQQLAERFRPSLRVEHYQERLFRKERDEKTKDRFRAQVPAREFIGVVRLASERGLDNGARDIAKRVIGADAPEAHFLSTELGTLRRVGTEGQRR